MRRRIMFIAALLLTCGVWVAFIFARNARNDSIQQYAQLQNQVESLEAESNELQRMIEHTRSESQKELHSTATAEYLILDLDERLYSEVYEIMKPRDIPGVMLLGRQWPGDKDCITEEEFEALLDDGWSYVLCWSEEEDWLAGGCAGASGRSWAGPSRSALFPRRYVFAGGSRGGRGLLHLHPPRRGGCRFRRRGMVSGYLCLELQRRSPGYPYRGGAGGKPCL